MAQSSGQAPFTSEIVGSNLGSDSLHSCEKRVRQRSAKSRGFSPGTPVSSGYSGFLPLEMLTGLVEDHDGYSANPGP